MSLNQLIAWASSRISRDSSIRKAGASILRRVRPSYYQKPDLEGRELKDIFTEHYRSNYWRSSESASGEGSTMRSTANIRRELPKLFEKYAVRTLLDAPCGDYNWFRHVDRGPVQQYIGADIVADLIQQNSERYADAHTRFEVLDITSSHLPAVDLWMCRDALFHLSYESIGAALRNLLASNIKYILFTSHTDASENRDILSGDFRELNLEIEPFSFPEPLTVIDDWVKGFAVRKLCLWETEASHGELEKAAKKLASIAA